MKRLALILAISIVTALCLVLTGCGTLRYCMTVQLGGARTIEYIVDMTGESDQAFDKALAYATAIVQQRQEGGRPSVLTTEGKVLRITEEYASADEYYIAAGYTGWEPNEPDEYQEEGMWRVYSSTSAVASRGAVVHYALGYVSYADPAAYNAFRAYWQDKSVTLSAPDKDVASAVANAENMSLVLTAYLGQEGETSDRLYQYAKQGFASVGYDLEKMAVKYDYQHVYKSVYFEDATVIPSGDGKVYEWQTDLASLADMQITIKQKAPAVWAWELVAIASGVLVMGVIVGIVVFKRRKQNAARQREED